MGGENELEEPLGRRLFYVTNFVTLFAFAALVARPSHAQSEASCSERIRDQIAASIDHVSENSPENTAQARKILHKLQDEIARRVTDVCPETAACSDEQLAEALLQITHEVLDENPPVKTSWRSNIIFGRSLVLYTALSVWVTMQTQSMATAAASSLLTVLGAMAILKSGASKIEVPLAKLRRASYAADGGHGDKARGKRQRRHEQIYWGTQAVEDEIEEEGRNTERHVVGQICAAKGSCNPHPWDTRDTYRTRSAFVLAKTLSDLVPSYLELDFSEPFYSTWFRTLFSEWELNGENREDFRQAVMAIIAQYYDSECVEGSERQQLYERVLRSWTGPLVPLISPRGTHQSRIERPSRKGAVPLLGWPLATPSLRLG
jgi:hypothetical protein